MAAYRTIDDLDVAGKRVLLRGDLNVPMRDGRITDTTRIDRLTPTITELAGKGARVIVMSHFGRPKGEVVADMSLEPLVSALSASLGGKHVTFIAPATGDGAAATVAGLADGDVALLENTRFFPGEEANDPEFAAALAALGDVYVNDAFSAAHRAHASTEAVAKLLPSAAGRLMQAELEALETALGVPERPVAAIVGGAKVSSKLDLLGNLVDKVDLLVIGGAMANTFLFALGIDVAKSLYEPDLADTARAILAKAEAEGCEIALPSDVVTATEFVAGAAAETVPVAAVPTGTMILDIGPASVAGLIDRLADVRTLVWNGPLGAFETPPFDAATIALARAVADLTEDGSLASIAGGGDTLAALAAAGVTDRLSYVSTAGGAFLEWLEGKTLPGVAALSS